MANKEFIRSVASTNPRGNFRQKTLASFTLTITDFDGTPQDPSDIHYTIIKDSDGTIAQEGIPDKINQGMFVFDWNIPRDQETGQYMIEWEYLGSDGVLHNEYYSLNVASNQSQSSFYSGRVLDLRNALELMICCAQNVPIYNQQAQPSADGKTFKFTKGHWNQKSGTRIYRNGKIQTSGFEIDYNNGMVVFEDEQTEFDVITADYNFRWFPDEQLDRFISNGLHRLNSYPPAGKKFNIATLPEHHISVVLYGAVVDALRTLLLCINFQEPAQYFGGIEKANAAFGQFETLKQNYEGDMKELLEQKKLGPYAGLTRVITQPTHTLPGGRARWMRSLFKGGNV